ncbi:unnamed protein product [Auanema sp. JU1783]|nr:unnamed protein product [Auanema sp. JU1783]
MLIEPKTRNVVQIGIGMCCVFFAFTSQGFIVETVLAGKHRSDSKISEHAGYYSQTIVYGAFIFSNAVAPVFLKIMNVKWSLVLGSSTYTLFMLGFQFLNPYYLYVSSAIEGFGAGLLWTAFGHSIAINSNENTIARNSSIAWIIYSSSFIYGGVFLVAMFGHDKRVTISDQTMHQLYGAFAAVCFLGNITFALLPSKMEDCNTDVPAASTTENGLSDCLNELKASWNLLLQPKMFFLCFIFAYSGMELSFWSSVYSTSLSFTKLFKINTNVLIGLNSICVGVGELFAGIAFGVFGKRTSKFGNYPIVFFGISVGLISYVLTVINLPSNSPYEDSYGKSLITPRF